MEFENNKPMKSVIKAITIKDNLKMIVARLRSPDVQRQIKTEKVLAVIVSTLFAGGLLYSVLAAGTFLSGLVFLLLVYILIKIQEPSEEVV